MCVGGCVSKLDIEAIGSRPELDAFGRSGGALTTAVMETCR
jgi:hypothetical protein